MYYINESNEQSLYIRQIDNIFIWVYNSPLDKEFLQILEDNNALGIEFKPSFNHNISRLPNCIKKIIFPINSDFNQPLENLPSGLEHLELYDKFNQPLDFLPTGLKKLIINADFNYPLNNLPAGLEYLEIRGAFNHPLDNLPISLRGLRIKNINEYDDYHKRSAIIRKDNITRFNQPIRRLPPNIEIIEFSHNIFNADNLNKYGLSSLKNVYKSIYDEYPRLHSILI